MGMFSSTDHIHHDSGRQENGFQKKLPTKEDADQRGLEIRGNS